MIAMTTARLHACRLSAFLGLAFLLVTGCQARPTVNPTPAPVPTLTAASTATSSPTPVPPATPTVAPSTTPRPGLVVGAVGAGTLPSEYLDRYGDWTARLGQAAGISLTLRADFPTELALLQAMSDGDVALARLSAWGYVHAHARGWVQPGMMDLTYDGKEASAISFFARTDSGLVPGALPYVLQQLRGKRPCYLKRNSNAAFYSPMDEYILPAGLLAHNGIAVASPVLLEGAGSSAVEIAVFRQECDFGREAALPATGFENRMPAGLGGVSLKQFGSQMQVLVTTGPIEPSGLFAFSSALPRAQREAINALLPAAGFPEPSALQAAERRMAPFNEQLFDQYAQIVAASGVNLEDYLGPSNATRPATVTPAPPGWAAAPADTLVIDVQTRGERVLIPYSGSASPLQRLVLPAIHAELARLDAHGHYFPYLATSLPSLDDGLVRFVGVGEDQRLEVEFVLRPGLTWHDGQPLTADDLAFSWQLVTDSRWPGGHRGQAGEAAEVYVSDVQVPARDRVVYRFMSQREARDAAHTGGRLSDPAIYASVAEQVGPVVPIDYPEVGRNVFPRHLLQGMSPLDVATGAFARHPIYAGPYRLVSSGEADGDPIVLEAFPGFALGKPQIGRVVFGASYSNPAAGTEWQSPAQLAEALKVGAVGAQLGRTNVKFTEAQALRDYDTLGNGNAARVLWPDEDLWEVLDFNLDNPHLADLKVRQAIAYVVDRPAIIQQVLGGHGSPIRSYAPSNYPLYAGDDALPAYAHNTAAARSLLQQAGYDLSQGTAVHPTRGPLVLQLHTMEVAPYPRAPITALLQKQLAEVGIRVEVTFHPWNDFERNDCAAIRNGRHFDLGLAGYLGVGEVVPIVWVETSALSSAVPGPANGCGAGKQNWPGWRSAQADALYPQLRDGRLALENPDQYRRAWAEHQRLWATDLPSLPLFTYQRPVVSTTALTGLEPPLYGIGSVEDTWNIHQWSLNRAGGQ